MIEINKKKWCERKPNKYKQLYNWKIWWVFLFFFFLFCRCLCLLLKELEYRTNQGKFKIYKCLKKLLNCKQLQNNICLRCVLVYILKEESVIYGNTKCWMNFLVWTKLFAHYKLYFNCTFFFFLFVSFWVAFWLQWFFDGACVHARFKTKMTI